MEMETETVLAVRIVERRTVSQREFHDKIEERTGLGLD